MSVEDVKHGIASLSSTEQVELSAFLFHLRHVTNPDYQELVTARLSDTDAARWLTPEEFERQLDQK